MSYGSQVTVPPYGTGKIAWKGCFQGTLTEYVGILLDKPHPQGNDGTHFGKRYFFCKKGWGAFVKYDEVINSESKPLHMKNSEEKSGPQISGDSMSFGSVEESLSDDAYIEIMDNDGRQAIPFVSSVIEMASDASKEMMGNDCKQDVPLDPSVVETYTSSVITTEECKSNYLFPTDCRVRNIEPGGSGQIENSRSNSKSVQEGSDEYFARMLHEQFIREEQKGREATKRDEDFARRLAEQERLRPVTIPNQQNNVQIMQDEALARMLSMEVFPGQKRSEPWTIPVAKKQRTSEDTDMLLALQLQNEPSGWPGLYSSGIENLNMSSVGLSSVDIDLTGNKSSSPIQSQ